MTVSARGSGPKKGVFGACMGVALVNDGPVTLMLEVEPPGHAAIAQEPRLVSRLIRDLKR